MADFKSPSLDSVLKKLESLDIREWSQKSGEYGRWLIARTGPFKVAVYKWGEYHKIALSNCDETFCLRYCNAKKGSVEEEKISNFYNKLCKEYDGHKRKEFYEQLDHVFSD